MRSPTGWVLQPLGERSGEKPGRVGQDLKLCSTLSTPVSPQQRYLLSSVPRIVQALEQDKRRVSERESCVELYTPKALDVSKIEKPQLQQVATRVFQRFVLSLSKPFLPWERMGEALDQIAAALSVPLLRQRLTALADAAHCNVGDGPGVGLEDFLRFADGAFYVAGRRPLHVANLVDKRKIADQPRFRDTYEILKQLGQGSYGRVALCTESRSGVQRVVKIISKEKTSASDQDQVEVEIEILRKLDHPHVVRLYEVLEDGQHFYLIFEACRGGELVPAIAALDKGKRDYNLVCAIVKQILLAVAYCHENRIVHQDLKLANILLAESLEMIQGDSTLLAPHVVVADFGLAEIFAAGQPYYGFASGTPLYMAPEKWQGGGGPWSDVWSVGIITFVLLTGELPYQIPQKSMREDKVPRWGTIKNPRARNMVKLMLRRDASQRPEATSLLQHEWLTSMPQGDSKYAGGDDAEDPKAISVSGDALLNFHKCSEVSQITARLCAWHLPHSRLEAICQKFKEMDIDQDSQLTLAELQAGLEGIIGDGVYSTAAQELHEAMTIFDAVDSDLNGCITWSEFAAGVLNLADENLDDTLWQCFQAFDSDNSSFIEPAELEAMLHLLHFGVQPDSRAIQNKNLMVELSALSKSASEMVEAMDRDRDGKISFRDFKAYLKRELKSLQRGTNSG